MSEPHVYLDGHETPASEITPARHRFIGTFRHPSPPHTTCNLWCPCGAVLQSPGEVRRHWHEGHFDTPQYVTQAEQP